MRSIVLFVSAHCQAILLISQVNRNKLRQVDTKPGNVSGKYQGARRTWGSKVLGQLHQGFTLHCVWPAM